VARAFRVFREAVSPADEVRPEATPRARITRAALLASGGTLLVAAAVYNEWTLGLISSGEFRELARSRIHATQLAFGLGGVLLVVASELVRRVPALRALAGTRAAPLVVLAALALLGPPFLLDLGLRPFVEPKTRLFVPDAELGWRPRPGVKTEWGHVRVEINAKGLRGPEVAWTKPAGTLRILYLGDSVTFGFGLERVEDTYPYVVGAALEQQLETPVETVNSGVGGWSPWQQYAYLQRDGLRYQPDVIVVGFVLNDITEKFSLLRFGGTSSGWHLSRVAQSRLDHWLSQSAIVSFAREGIAQFRFGADVFVGAQRYEAEEVRWLAAHARGERLRRAWEITFENLEKIFATASDHGIGAVLAVFPYAFQLDEPATTGAPQQMLREFAEARGIPYLDLMPALAAEARAGSESGGAGVRALYLDPAHFSTRGNRAVGAAIAEFLRVRGLVTPGG